MSRTIYNILTAITALCIVTACTDNMEVAEEAVTGDATAGYTFTIDGDAVTRLSHSGVTTTFESGEAVGCILCTMDTEGNYTYKANSKWTYSGGYLVPTMIYTTTSATDDSGITTSSTTSASVPTYSSASSDDLLAYNENYVYVTSSDRLYPFFYYPFIDNTTYSNVPSYSVSSSTTTLGEDTTDEDTTEETTETTTYLLMGLAGESTDTDYSDITTTGEDGTQTSTGYKTKTYAWTSYPVFINTDQSAESTTDDDGNTTTTTYKQDYSDFLWTSYPTGISSYSTGEINLEFEKKTATIEIDADEAISSVALYPTTSTESTESTGRIDVGNYINLKTGEYDTSSDNGLYYHRLTSSTDYITPMTVTSGTDYRFILPPQTSLTGNEVIQFNYDSDDETTRTIKLTDIASKLEAGKYYKVNVEKNTYYIYFTSSDVTGDGTDFVTLSSSANIKNDASGITINNTTCNYYLYQSGGGSDFGITITLSHAMYVRFYFGTADNDIRCKLDIKNEDTGTETTYVYSTSNDNLKDYSTSSSGEGAYMTVYLEKGTYTLNKASSGSERIYYIQFQYYYTSENDD